MLLKELPLFITLDLRKSSGIFVVLRAIINSRTSTSGRRGDIYETHSTYTGKKSGSIRARENRYPFRGRETPARRNTCLYSRVREGRRKIAIRVKQASRDEKPNEIRELPGERLNDSVVETRRDGVSIYGFAIP